MDLLLDSRTCYTLISTSGPLYRIFSLLGTLFSFSVACLAVYYHSASMSLSQESSALTTESYITDSLLLGGFTCILGKAFTLTNLLFFLTCA